MMYSIVMMIKKKILYENRLFCLLIKGVLCRQTCCFNFRCHYPMNIIMVNLGEVSSASRLAPVPWRLHPLTSCWKRKTRQPGHCLGFMRNSKQVSLVNDEIIDQSPVGMTLQSFCLNDLLSVDCPVGRQLG